MANVQEATFSNKDAYSYKAFYAADPYTAIYRVNQINNGEVFVQVTETDYSVSVEFYLTVRSKEMWETEHSYLTLSYSRVDNIKCCVLINEKVTDPATGPTQRSVSFEESLGYIISAGRIRIGGITYQKGKRTKTVRYSGVRFTLVGAKFNNPSSADDTQSVVLAEFPTFTVEIPPTIEEARVKANGEWKTANIMIKNDGEWKYVTEGFVKVDGTWKEMV